MGILGFDAKIFYKGSNKIGEVVFILSKGYFHQTWEYDGALIGQNDRAIGQIN